MKNIGDYKVVNGLLTYSLNVDFLSTTPHLDSLSILNDFISDMLEMKKTLDKREDSQKYNNQMHPAKISNYPLTADTTYPVGTLFSDGKKGQVQFNTQYFRNNYNSLPSMQKLVNEMIRHMTKMKNDHLNNIALHIIEDAASKGGQIQSGQVHQPPQFQTTQNNPNQNTSSSVQPLKQKHKIMGLIKELMMGMGVVYKTPQTTQFKKTPSP